MSPSKLRDLDEALELATDEFKKNVNLELETFSQSHDNKYLTKDDMEEIACETFYALNKFRNELIKYLKEKETR